MEIPKIFVFYLHNRWPCWSKRHIYLSFIVNEFLTGQNGVSPNVVLRSIVWLFSDPLEHKAEIRIEQPQKCGYENECKQQMFRLSKIWWIMIFNLCNWTATLSLCFVFLHEITWLRMCETIKTFLLTTEKPRSWDLPSIVLCFVFSLPHICCKINQKSIIFMSTMHKKCLNINMFFARCFVTKSNRRFNKRTPQKIKRINVYSFICISRVSRRTFH